MHQGFHVHTDMVASGMTMHVLPDPLDLVPLLVVPRQEVQHDPILCLLQRQVRQTITVDAVVVQDHLNHLGLRIGMIRFTSKSTNSSPVFLVPSTSSN